MNSNPAQLHQVTGPPGACGPSVLSAVLGIPTNESAALLREVTGKARIRGVHFTEMIEALRQAGWECKTTWFRSTDSPTFAGRLAGRDTVSNLYIVVLSYQEAWHFVAVGGGQVVDSGWMYLRPPMPLDEAPARWQARVQRTIFSKKAA